MKDIIFSVVIPLFNKEKHISRAINSVLNQTYKNFELIVVDDGSTDNSVSVINKINDPRIRVIRQNNEGVSSARNKGINKAKYTYVGFLDADDEWKPNFLKNIRELINLYPKAGAYATSYEMKKEDGKLDKSPCERFFPEQWKGLIDDYFKYAIIAPIITASSIVIHKKVFSNIGNFPLGIKRGEDLDMWRRIALKYDIAYLNQSCVFYYMDTDNRSCSKESKLSNSSAFFSEKLFLESKNIFKYSNYYKEYIIKSIIIKARYLINEGKKKEARRLLYKYRYTKLNKRFLLKVFLISFLPKNILEIIYTIKNNFKSVLQNK
jgi:glycosyltransferase involved in cell wall biosynthesis